MTRAQVRACEVIAGLKSAVPRIRRGIKQEILSAEQLRSVRRAARIRSIHRAGEMKRADLRSVSGCGAGGRAALCIRSWGGEGRGGGCCCAALAGASQGRGCLLCVPKARPIPQPPTCDGAGLTFFCGLREITLLIAIESPGERFYSKSRNRNV